MENLWETLREFFSTLGTLGKAQSILVPLLASWVFTGMWVYATERKRHGKARPGRAWLGLFWLPGLLIYYLFPGEDPSAKAQPPLRVRQTPETMVAPRHSRGQNRGENATTLDGSGAEGAARPRRVTDKTDDGASLQGSRAAASARRPQAPPFYLEVLNGELKGKRLQAPAGYREVSIGSRNNNTLRLEDASIALWHVQISFEKPGKWTLRVHKSAAKYRTEVNGTAVAVKSLLHRDEIRLGEIRLRFNCPEC